MTGDCPHFACKDREKCGLWPDLPPGSEFPAPQSEINWPVVQELAGKPHPLLYPERPVDAARAEGRELHYGVTEVLYEARAVHHLLDLAGVPQHYSADTGDIASRTLIAILGMGTLRERLDRIAGWHERETGPARMTGDFCTECGHRWPCDTRRMAEGIYRDPEDGGALRETETAETDESCDGGSSLWHVRGDVPAHTRGPVRANVPGVQPDAGRGRGVLRSRSPAGGIPPVRPD
jgi:hypothetical protein